MGIESKAFKGKDGKGIGTIVSGQRSSVLLYGSQVVIENLGSLEFLSYMSIFGGCDRILEETYGAD